MSWDNLPHVTDTEIIFGFALYNTFFTYKHLYNILYNLNESCKP